MKAHKINPDALAKLLAQESSDGWELWRDDIRENPELYLSDHVAASEAQGELPLSEVAWRRVALSR